MPIADAWCGRKPRGIPTRGQLPGGLALGSSDGPPCAMVAENYLNRPIRQLIGRCRAFDVNLCNTLAVHAPITQAGLLAKRGGGERRERPNGRRQRIEGRARGRISGGSLLGERFPVSVPESEIRWGYRWDVERARTQGCFYRRDVFRLFWV